MNYRKSQITMHWRDGSNCVVSCREVLGQLIPFYKFYSNKFANHLCGTGQSLPSHAE
jgi:hypothetical protein